MTHKWGLWDILKKLKIKIKSIPQRGVVVYNKSKKKIYIP